MIVIAIKVKRKSKNFFFPSGRYSHGKYSTIESNNPIYLDRHRCRSPWRRSASCRWSGRRSARPCTRSGPRMRTVSAEWQPLRPRVERHWLSWPTTFSFCSCSCEARRGVAWLARSPPGYFTNSSILVTLGGVLIALVSPSEHHSPRARTPTTRRTRDRMVRRTNRATANVHRCFSLLRAAPRLKRGARAPRGNGSRQFASSHGTRSFQRSESSDPISFGYVPPEWGWLLLAHDDHFPNVFLNPPEEGGTGLVEKRSIGSRVPRSPGGNRKLSRRIGQ